MKINLEINKKVSNPLSKKFLEKIVIETIKCSGYSFLSSKKVAISLALVSEEEIKKINKKYRGKETVTDILSFADYKNKKDILRERSHDVFLGELLICCDYIKKSVEKDKATGALFKSEIVEIISHGVLHLLGFKHGKKMFSIQNEVSQIFFRK